MLVDPRDAFAEHGSVVHALTGLVGLARMVRARAEHDGRRAGDPGVADEFVHLLLGVASLGAAVQHLAQPDPAASGGADPAGEPGAPGVVAMTARPPCCPAATSSVLRCSPPPGPTATRSGTTSSCTARVGGFWSTSA